MILVLVVAASAMMLAGYAVGAPLAADEIAKFTSLDQQTMLVAPLFRPKQPGPHPAVVLLHGCSGIGRGGDIFGVYRVWAETLVEQGYVVLLVDSASPRGFDQTCNAGPARPAIYADRSRDAYAALAWLQAQPFVQPDRIGIVGWSQGGGVVLLSISARNSGRPVDWKAADFRVAVAFYPSLCGERLASSPLAEADQRAWMTAIPLLVLQGEADTWTPAAPCRAFIADAQSRGAPVDIHIYPDAHHSFDAPNRARRELPNYRIGNGPMPIIETNPEARHDALVRMPAFLRAHLDD
jgi:dienelactone hydrolase